MHSFLADIGSEPELFNRVFINESGIYYLEKNKFIDDDKKVKNQIIVSHIQ